MVPSIVGSDQAFYEALPRLYKESPDAITWFEGKPGVIDAYCPHRGAPMFFGRNEEEGIRCLYHGWKFDTEGNCVEMPNIPHGETAKNRMHLDLRAPGAMDDEVRRLERLGASVLRRGEALTTMADPEGNEFCVEPGPATRS